MNRLPEQKVIRLVGWLAGQPDDRTNVATADRLIGYLTGWAFSQPLVQPSSTARFSSCSTCVYKWLPFGIMWLILVIYN